MALVPVSRILFVKNLKYVSRKLNTYALQPTESISNPQVAIVWRTYRLTTVFSISYNVTAEQLFDLFGKFGPIR